MSNSRVLGLALAVMFVAGAVTAVGAYASEPAFYECAKVSGGKYEKGCGKEGGKGGYVLREGVGSKPAFKGKGGKATLHTPAVSGEITCGSFKDSGKLSGPKTEDKIVSIFSKCTSLGKNCNSPGEKKGTIETKDLAGELGYISASKHEVGVDLKPESGERLAEFECEGLSIVVTGSVIGQVTPVNTFSKEATVAFEVNSEKFQKYTALEGQPEDVLETAINGTGPYASGQECAAVDKGEELEIKA